MGFPGLLNTLGPRLDRSQTIKQIFNKSQKHVYWHQGPMGPRGLGPWAQGPQGPWAHKIKKSTNVGKYVPIGTKTYQAKVGKNVPRRTKKKFD